MSVFSDLLAGTTSAIEALNFTWGEDLTAVDAVVRYQPVNRDDLEDPLPFVVVCPAVQPERVEQGSTENQAFVTYSVDIAVIGPGNGDLSSNLATYLGWRETLRQALQRIQISAVPRLFFVRLKPGPTFDRQLAADNYDFLLLTVEYEVAEAAS